MNESKLQNAPEPLAPVPFDIPRPFRTKLDNGLRVVIFEHTRLPLVNYRLALSVGDAADPDELTGLTSAMTSLMTEGTQNYSSKALAEKIERLGASVSANSTDDFTMLSASALSLYHEDIVELLAEVLFWPTFPENELDLYKRNAIENIKFQRSQPPFLAAEQVGRLIYGEHPYGRVSPTAAEIENLTRGRLTEFHRRTFVPENAVLVVVGDVSREEVLEQLGKHLGEWSGRSAAKDPFPETPKRKQRSLTIVDRPGSAQSNIVIANRAMERVNPDYFPVLVMNQVLGAGASSRVFMNLREEKGYTYGAYTRFDMKLAAGTFEATAEVRTAVTGDSVKEFFYELERIRETAVSDEELADAKNFLAGVFPIRAETHDGLTSLIVNQELFGLPDDFLETYRDNINAVTAEDVKRVAEKYVRPDEFAIVIVGDAYEVMTQAAKFADTAEVFDINGDPKNLEAAPSGEALGEPADVSGKWSLVLNFQGQSVPVTLTLTQIGDAVDGKLETMLGDGKISGGTVRGARLSATATAEMQGQAVEFVIAGEVKGTEMSGTITAPIVPEPLTFSGTRGE